MSEHPRPVTVREIANMLDLLVLSSESTPEDVVEACQSAAQARLATVYCLTHMVPQAADELSGSGVGVGTVVPAWDVTEDLAATLTIAKRVLQEGSTEIAIIVANPWWRLHGDAILEREVRALAELAAEYGARLKMVFLPQGLDRTELARGCRLAQDAGAHILQGGSWFTSDIATMSDLQVMRAATSPPVVIKGARFMKSLDLLLLGFAQGLGRFNVQRVDRILAEAKWRSDAGELYVPSADVPPRPIPM